MSECKFDDGSRINAADEGALERAVGSNMLEGRNDGLVGKPITPRAMACSAAPALRVDMISSSGSLGLHIVGIPEHPAALILLTGKIR
jgi:hypothetical protein